MGSYQIEKSDSNVYDLKGNLIESACQLYSDYPYSSRDIYAYDTKGNKSFHWHLIYNDDAKNWDIRHTDSLTYDDRRNLVTKIGTDWSDHARTWSLLTTYQYDTCGREIFQNETRLDKNLNPTGLSSLKEHQYDQHGNLTYESAIDFGYGREWGWRKRMYYEAVSHPKVRTSSPAEISISPAPAASVLHVSITTSLVGEPFAVYDMSGRQVLISSSNESNFDVEIDGLATGIYILAYQNGVSKKFIVR